MYTYIKTLSITFMYKINKNMIKELNISKQGKGYYITYRDNENRFIIGEKKNITELLAYLNKISK